MKIRVLIGPPKSDRLEMTDYSAPYGTPAVVEADFEVSQSIGSALDVLRIDLHDPTNAYSIEQGHDILVEDFDNPSEKPVGSYRIFGGIINQVGIASVGVGRIIRLVAIDWTMLLDRNTIRKVYETVGQNDKSIILNAFEEANLTELDLSNVHETRDIEVLNFQGSTLSTVLNTISTISGAIWYVDYHKRLWYHPRSFVGLDFAFSDKPNNTYTFPFSDLRVDKNLAEWNTIEIVGGGGLSDDVDGDIYSGDGATKIFITGGQTGTNPIHYPRVAEDRVEVDVNTGTNATPVWTAQDVQIEDEPGITLGTNADVLWNPIYGRLQFHTAPPNFVNGFRVKGRYLLPIIVIADDTTALADHGRVFKSSLIVPEATKEEYAHDLALAYLREHSDRLNLVFRTRKDKPEVNATTTITSSIHGLDEELILIRRVTTRIVGGITAEYDVEAEIINPDLYKP